MPRKNKTSQKLKTYSSYPPAKLDIVFDSKCKKVLKGKESPEVGKVRK
jgi:hypothetical protein